MDNSQPLSSAVPGLAQCAHEWSSCGSEYGDYIRAHQHGLPLTKADRATANAGCSACQQQRQMLKPQHGTLPQRAQPATGKPVDYNVPLSVWRVEQ